MSSNGDDSGPFNFFFDRFVDRSNPRLSGKVDFGGIIGTTINALILTVFLGLVGVTQSAQRAFSTTVEAFNSMIRLILSAPTLTLAEIQQRAVAIAAMEILTFDLFALPVGVVAALAAIGVLAIAFNVFVR